MKEQLKHEITMSPAFDKRHSDPSKNYGIHGVDLRMVVIGTKGAIQFVLYTGWHLSNVRAEGVKSEPLPADVGYHSHTPMYEGQEVQSNSCPYLDGKPCYYDGSDLYAEKAFDVLTKEGDVGLWKFLEDEYFERFS